MLVMVHVVIWHVVDEWVHTQILSAQTENNVYLKTRQSFWGNQYKKKRHKLFDEVLSHSIIMCYNTYLKQ